jgi:hypothetical protein
LARRALNRKPVGENADAILEAGGIATVPEKPKAPPEIVSQYDRLVAALPEVQRKGATMPYTAVNGNMFSYLDASGLMALRLPPDARAVFIATYRTHLHEAYGFVQKEYVTVPPELLADTDRLLPHLAASHAYALTLRPKPSKK